MRWVELLLCPLRPGLCLKMALIATLTAGWPAAPAQAQKSADTLRVAWRDAIPDIDPYYNALRTGLVLAHHVWDCLVDRDDLAASRWYDNRLHSALGRDIPRRLTVHGGRRCLHDQHRNFRQTGFGTDQLPLPRGRREIG